jgi:hypothetical protein
MTAPTVSVIMAAYNGAAFLPETIASLQAQTFGDFEVVIVDDCSTDDTRDVLRRIQDPRFRVIENPINEGPVRTRNTAVTYARGRYLAGLDQDDLCLPERFAAQVAYLDTNPDTVLLGTAAAVLEDGVVGPPQRTWHTTPDLIEWLMLIENPLVWSSVMVRAAAASDPFTNPDRLYAEDFDLYHRMARKGRVARLDTPLVVYRRHPGGASKRYTERMCASAATVLAEAYADLFLGDALDVAQLIVRHMMDDVPVPDGQTLLRLGEALAQLQRHFLDTHDVDTESQRLIRWETARRWGLTSRYALRHGTIGLQDAMAARLDHLGLGHTGLDDLVMSRLLGRARVARRRYRR